MRSPSRSGWRRWRQRRSSNRSASSTPRSVYLIAVVLAAALLGTWAAIGTSVIAFLVYDFLFTTPRFTFAVSDPAEWLNLLLFLIVAVVIGRLTALLRDRAEEADRRIREGVALVAMSHDVAMTAAFDEAAAAIADRLLIDSEMESVWVTDAASSGPPIASAGAGVPAEPGRPWTLMRSTEDEGSDWLRLHGDGSPQASPEGGPQHYVVIHRGGRRPRGLDPCDAATRGTAAGSRRPAAAGAGSRPARHRAPARRAHGRAHRRRGRAPERCPARRDPRLRVP